MVDAFTPKKRTPTRYMEGAWNKQFLLLLYSFDEWTLLRMTSIGPYTYCGIGNKENGVRPSTIQRLRYTTRRLIITVLLHPKARYYRSVGGEHIREKS